MEEDFLEEKGFSFSLRKLLKGLARGPMPEGGTESSTAFLDQDENEVVHTLVGGLGAVHGFSFPAGLIGGCCPRVSGEEENIVWNAAAEAADCERIRVVWRARGEKIWYIAVPAEEMATHTGTWCPFAAFLPEEKSEISLPACYTYYTDEAATVMTVTEDSLQIHRGTSSILHVKVERTAQEYNGTLSVIDVTPDLIESLTPVPWHSVSLFEDRARRIWSGLSIVTSLAVAVVATAVWLMVSMSILAMHSDLSDIKARTEQKTMLLLRQAQNLRASPMREQLGKFADVNDGLLALNGFLEFYQVTAGKASWRAVIPPNITSDRISEIGAVTIDTTPKGVVIGSGRDVTDPKNGK